MFYKMSEYSFVKYEKSSRKDKKYNAVLKCKLNKRIVKIPFGSLSYTNYRDKTKLNLYPHLINNDPEKRRLYKLRHNKDLREGYYSAGYFSYWVLW